MPDHNADGVQYGTPLITIGSDEFTLDSIDWSQGSTEGDQFDESGVYSGGFTAAGKTTGTANCQVGDSTPAICDTFTADIGQGSATYEITNVGKRFENTGITKVPISFKKLINGGS